LVLIPVALILLASTPMIGAPDVYLITPGVGIGPIRIGLHIGQVTGILGTPKSTISGRDGSVVYTWFDPKERRKEGLGVRTFQNGVIDLIWAQNDARYHTPNGIHPGSTEADLNAAFGVPPRMEKSQTGGTDNLWYDAQGIRFSINRVTSLRFYNQVFSIEVFRPGPTFTPAPTPTPGPNPIPEPAPGPGPNPILLP